MQPDVNKRRYEKHIEYIIHACIYEHYRYGTNGIRAFVWVLMLILLFFFCDRCVFTHLKMRHRQTDKAKKRTITIIIILCVKERKKARNGKREMQRCFLITQYSVHFYSIPFWSVFSSTLLLFVKNLFIDFKCLDVSCLRCFTDQTCIGRFSKYDVEDRIKRHHITTYL